MRNARNRAIIIAQSAVLVGLAHCLLGCGDRIRLPSAERLVEFETAGPEGPSVDMDRIIRARIPVGPYRVAIGDVLQLTMPSSVFPDASQAAPATPGEVTRRCRVSDAGLITLPQGHQISVVGKSLAEIEAAVVDAYYPEFLKIKPSVYAEVLEYKTHRVQILGGVARPGPYNLRHDQMSLSALILEAGGIVEQGAAVIRIAHSHDSLEQSVKSAAPDRPILFDVERRQEDAGADAFVHQAVLTGARFADASSPVRMWFRPEGPLRTTGWIVIERSGERLVRQWLDIGNGPQKQAVLQAATARFERLPIGLLNQKLLQLARTLEFGAGETAAHLIARVPHGDWQRVNGGDFMVSVDDSSQEKGGRYEVPPAWRTFAGPAVAATPKPADGTVVLPVKGLNIPFVDVALNEADSVIVERLQVQYVSVLGLVRTPGNFPYPVDAQFNLAEVLAFAGGLDTVAEPRYVTLYRLKADGTIASATFQLVDPRNQEELTASLALAVKPGDVVSVESTPRTRTNVFLDRYFRLSMGVYLRPEQLWGEE